MTTKQKDGALAHVGYMRRTRDFYRAMGYDNDYRWARIDEIAFTPPPKPLAQCVATLITTACPPGGPSGGNRRLKEVWSLETANAPKDLHTELSSWDKEATHTDDRESYLPLNALADLVAAGRLGGLTRHFHGVPTTYSHRVSIEQDAPDIVRRCQDDGTDIALLVPL